MGPKIKQTKSPSGLSTVYSTEPIYLSNQIFPSLDEGTQYFSSVYHSLRPPLPTLSTLAWSWPSTSVC